MMDCLPMLGLHFAGISKFLNWSYHRRKVVQLLNHMQYDWNNLKNESDSSVLDKFCHPDRSLFTAYAIGIYGTTAVYFVTPFVPIVLNIILPLNESRPHLYLYHTEYFVDQNEYYYPIQLHAYLAISVSVTCLVSFDQMCAMFIHHACGMFEILKLHLQNLHNTLLTNDGKNVTTAEERAIQEIVYCLQTHNRIFEFLDVVEIWDQMIMLMVGAGNTLIITACGVGGILNHPDFWGVIRLFLFNYGAIIHFFYNCWQGHLILKQGESIFIAAYQNDWYKLPCRVQRMLLPVMAKSIKPCELTAAHLFPMTLTTFGMVRPTMSAGITEKLNLELRSTNRLLHCPNLCSPIELKAMRAAISYFTLFQSMK
ncbi:odorant receptor 22a-like [Diachasmimorpha longicaudata]|uniref:odorant receptor 22a-like n=1 Tax=Diachasmimorpha longicaudata TaxID=58733 RepID=UPI0030B88A3F